METFSASNSLSGELYNLSFDSVDEEADVPWHTLIQNLSFDQLQAIKNVFRAKNSYGTLDKDEFLDAVTSIVESAKYSLQTVLLFAEIAKNGQAKITWKEFIDFLIVNLGQESKKPVATHITKILPVSHIKNETIVKIVLIETDRYFCYAMVSKHGRVGLYDGNLNFLTTYHLIMTREDINRKEEERRRRNRWVTDAIFCPDVLMFIATNSARSITIYEASGLKHVALWLILSTPNIVQSLSYKCCEDTRHGITTLFMGDNSGEVSSFNFLQPKVGLFRKKHNDKISLFYWEELRHEKDFVVYKNYGRFHKEAISQVQYFPQNGTLMTCSRDNEVSVMKKYLGNRGQSYIFKMTRGTRCFALSELSKILATGSSDGVLRLWNPVITSCPIATLTGHNAEIVDIAIMENQQVFFSCSRDGVLKLWGLKDQNCYQTIKIKFPPFSVLGKSIEWGLKCLYPGPKRGPFEERIFDSWERPQILVTCCNYYALLTLTFDDPKVERSFETPILPPPPLQHSVLVPKSWKISDGSLPQIEERSIKEVECIEIDQSTIASRINDLKFILERDFLGENGAYSDINYKIANLEQQKLKMQKHVAGGAPYLALDLHEIEDFQLSPDLPVPNRKRAKNLAENTQKILEKANSKDVLFSELSSSRSPRSSRSSVIEFSY